MASPAQYTFELRVGGVVITNDVGYDAIWQGKINCTATRPDPTTNIQSILISSVQKQRLVIPLNGFYTIDGHPAEDSIPEVLGQLNDIFASANS